jgi:hypothetical protein
MSTVIEKDTKHAANDPRVYHPLDRLRGIIRKYVVIEGILSVVIFMVAWFALAMILDYGVFKAFTWDWVQDGTKWIRVVALVVALTLLGSIVVYRIVRRLTTELTYPALALVLERRFPKVLGDRLITAVELVDVEKAASYGYSADMIRQTITEARERVGTVNVNEAFNWRRLRVMGIISVGVFAAVVAVAFASHAIATKAFQPAHAGWKFVHVVTIIAERDLFLRNTPWPRRALLELDPNIKETGIRVARDGSPPKVKIKSYRWVIADRNVPDGWRPLFWSDITIDRLGISAPALPFSSLGLPDEKGPLPTEADKWTVDAIWERARENSASRAMVNNAMSGDAFSALQAALDQLEEKANDPAMGRTLRHLDRPDGVSFEYVGTRTSGGGQLNPEGNDEYSGEIGGLREDVSFIIKAEDYRTPPRAITLIPPPVLVALSRVEYQPAYLYYPPPLGADPNRPNEITQLGPSSLKGKLQRKPEDKLSLTGDKSPFVVPTGTEVVITAVTELPITSAFARPKIGKVPGAKPGSAALVPLKLIDANTFTIEFKGESRVTSAVEFDLVFQNEDKVESSRTVSIQVTDDNAPVVEVAPEVIRRVGTLYYVTPAAKIPFNVESVIADDNGLSKVEYRVNYWPEDSPLGRALRCSNVTRMIVAPGFAGSAFPSAIQGAYNANAFRLLDRGEARQSASFLVGSYFELAKKIVPETQARMDQLLAEPRSDKPELVRKVTLVNNLRSEINRNKANGLIDSFKWVIQGDYFDVKALNLEVPTAGDVQPRYMVELNLWATDTNVDTGPKSSTHPEPIRLLVVSPSDLLYEISKDEEALGLKLDDAIKKIETSRKKYAFVSSKNGFVGLDEIDAVKVRAKDALQDVTKAKEIVQTIHREFRRIEKECIYNQLEDRNIIGTGMLANQIERVLGETPQPLSTAEDRQQQEGVFAAKPNFTATEKLFALVQNSLDENRWADAVAVTDTEIILTNLEGELRRIRLEIGEGGSYDKLKVQVNVLKEKQQRVKLDLRKWEVYWEGTLIATIPEISPVGQISLVKGETKKVMHNIRWLQYKEDNLNVKVTSSDSAGVIVPGVLKLDFEKDNLSFEYEIRAGNKAGDYTVTLEPEVGAKVQVKVTVK